MTIVIKHKQGVEDFENYEECIVFHEYSEAETYVAKAYKENEAAGYPYVISFIEGAEVR